MGKGSRMISAPKPIIPEHRRLKQTKQTTQQAPPAAQTAGMSDVEREYRQRKNQIRKRNVLAAGLGTAFVAASASFVEEDPRKGYNSKGWSDPYGKEWRAGLQRPWDEDS